MIQKRRKYDESNSHALATWALERLDKMEPKVDKLMSRQAAYAAGLTVVIVLAANGLLDLSRLVHSAHEDDAVAGEVEHAYKR